jgi:hypothetical protein
MHGLISAIPQANRPVGIYSSCLVADAGGICADPTLASLVPDDKRSALHPSDPRRELLILLLILLCLLILLSPLIP